MNYELKKIYLNMLFESHLSELDPVFTRPDIFADEVQKLFPLYEYIQEELSKGDSE